MRRVKDHKGITKVQKAHEEGAVFGIFIDQRGRCLPVPFATPCYGLTKEGRSEKRRPARGSNYPESVSIGHLELRRSGEIISPREITFMRVSQCWLTVNAPHKVDRRQNVSSSPGLGSGCF